MVLIARGNKSEVLLTRLFAVDCRVYCFWSKLQFNQTCPASI